MKISEKIVEIRQQPLHIRMRWVWGCVGFSMLIVFAVWILSISSLFQTETPISDQGNVTDLKTQLQNLQQQMPSLKNLKDQPLTAEQEGIANQSANDFQYKAPATDTTTAQSETYSDLPNQQIAQ